MSVLPGCAVTDGETPKPTCFSGRVLRLLRDSHFLRHDIPSFLGVLM